MKLVFLWWLLKPSVNISWKSVLFAQLQNLITIPRNVLVIALTGVCPSAQKKYLLFIHRILLCNLNFFLCCFCLPPNSVGVSSCYFDDNDFTMSLHNGIPFCLTTKLVACVLHSLCGLYGHVTHCHSVSQTGCDERLMEELQLLIPDYHHF